jgi:PST family polysaccharide transporter
LKRFFRKIRSSELINVSVFTGAATVVKLFTAFFTAKIIAIHLGPEGLGLLGQLSSFISIALVLSTGAVTNGVIKYLAEYKNDELKQKKIIKAAVVITLFCSTIISLTVILFASFWAKILFKDHAENYLSILTIFGFTIFFYASYTLFIAILNGLKEFRKYNYIGIWSSLIGLAFSIILVIYAGVYGALLAAITYQSIVFIIIIFYKSKIELVKWKHIKDINIQQADFVNLSKFSLMAIVSAATVPVSQIIIRNYLLNEIDAETVGYYEGINRLSNLYLTVITTTLSIYYLPKLSEITNNKLLKKEIFKGYKIILPATFIILVLVFLFKNLVINIVFSQKFELMEAYFLPQLIGDFFKIASWLLAFQMIAKAMTKIFIISEIFFSTLLVILTMSLINLYGGIGSVYAYAINYFIYFISMLIIFNRTIYDRKK